MPEAVKYTKENHSELVSSVNNFHAKQDKDTIIQIRTLKKLG